jgi:hypothetical protein
VIRRRARPNASLVSDLAAAAHYMLARYHVCAAQAAAWQMRVIINGYDDRKRWLIGRGDRELRAMALNSNNRPFPPDFALRQWAFRGVTDGEADRQRCNSLADVPWVMPVVDRLEWGVFSTRERGGVE